MKIWDCKYYEVLDFYQGGFVGECKKKQIQISDEEDICENCLDKEKREIEEGMFECLDLEKGVAYSDCTDCDNTECTNRNYFEKVEMNE